MSPYSSLLGKRVEIAYRIGLVELFAVGRLMGYSEESVVMEQDADQYGRVPVLKLTIPYSRIIRLSECEGSQLDACCKPAVKRKCSGSN